MLSRQQLEKLRLSQHKTITTQKEFHDLIDRVLTQIQLFQTRDEIIKARASLSADLFAPAITRSDEKVHVPKLRFGEEISRATRWLGIKVLLEALKKDDYKSNDVVAKWIMVDSLLNDHDDELFTALLDLVSYLQREKPAVLAEIKHDCDAYLASLKELDDTGGHSFPITYHGKK